MKSKKAIPTDQEPWKQAIDKQLASIFRPIEGYIKRAEPAHNWTEEIFLQARSEEEGEPPPAIELTDQEKEVVRAVIRLGVRGERVTDSALAKELGVDRHRLPQIKASISEKQGRIRQRDGKPFAVKGQKETHERRDRREEGTTISLQEIAERLRAIGPLKYTLFETFAWKAPRAAGENRKAYGFDRDFINSAARAFSLLAESYSREEETDFFHPEDDIEVEPGVFQNPGRKMRVKPLADYLRPLMPFFVYALFDRLKIHFYSSTEVAQFLGVQGRFGKGFGFALVEWIAEWLCENPDFFSLYFGEIKKGGEWKGSARFSTFFHKKMNKIVRQAANPPEVYDEQEGGEEEE